MLCSERLPAGRVATHRDDNGLPNTPEVVIDLSGSSPDLQPRHYARDRGGGQSSMDTDCLATDLNILHVSSTGAHSGVSSDASTPIGLIALSRLARSKDEITARRMSNFPIGVATLTALRSLVAQDSGLCGRH